MTTLSNHPRCGNAATRKRKTSLGIIIGCQRVHGTWADIIAMARNGYAVIRDGSDVRLIWSEAYEGGLQ